MARRRLARSPREPQRRECLGSGSPSWSSRRGTDLENGFRTRTATQIIQIRHRRTPQIGHGPDLRPAPVVVQSFTFDEANICGAATRPRDNASAAARPPILTKMVVDGTAFINSQPILLLVRRARSARRDRSWPWRATSPRSAACATLPQLRSPCGRPFHSGT